MMCSCERQSLTLDVGELDADAAVLDTLARLQLLARRYGLCIVLKNASVELEQLIELAGLSEVLPTARL
jgi:hypothetical protein